VKVDWQAQRPSAAPRSLSDPEAPSRPNTFAVCFLTWFFYGVYSTYNHVFWQNGVPMSSLFSSDFVLLYYRWIPDDEFQYSRYSYVFWHNVVLLSLLLRLNLEEKKSFVAGFELRTFMIVSALIKKKLNLSLQHDTIGTQA